MIGFVHNLLFLGKFSFIYNADFHTIASPWGAGIILVPVVGGIFVIWLVKNFAPEAKGHGVPEVMDAIYLKQGKIRPVVAVVKAIASAISIGSGGSVGREGPIIQIGSAFGSTLGTIINMPSWQRGILVAAGAAGGIAASFNTPVGALAFAMELMLASISAITLFPVAIATVTATLIGNLFFGNLPAFFVSYLTITNLHLLPINELLIFIPFGVCIGLVSLIFIRSIYWFEDIFEEKIKNCYWRHICGMLIMGTIMYLFITFTGHYYVEGVSYAAILDVLRGLINHPWILLLLCAAKLFSTGVTIGSGASGGVFSPSLFIGVTFGACFGIIAQYLFPALSIDPTIFAIAGMAGMVGGSTGAVLTAILMITEMTHDYNIFLPIITTVAIAYAVRKKICNENIYTLKLFRRGTIIPEGLQAAVTTAQQAQHVMNKTFRLVTKEQLQENISTYQYNQWQQLITIIHDTNQLLGIWRYPVIQNESQENTVEAYINKNFITVNEKENVPAILNKMKKNEANFVFVIKSKIYHTPENIIGVIGEQEIVATAIKSSELLH